MYILRLFSSDALFYVRLRSMLNTRQRIRVYVIRVYVYVGRKNAALEINPY